MTDPKAIEEANAEIVRQMNEQRAREKARQPTPAEVLNQHQPTRAGSMQERLKAVEATLTRVEEVMKECLRTAQAMKREIGG